MCIIQKTNNVVETTIDDGSRAPDFEKMLENVCIETRQILTVQKMALEALVAQEGLGDSKELRVARRVYHQQLRRCSNAEYLLQLKQGEVCLNLEEVDFVILCLDLIQTVDHLMRQSGVRVTFQTGLNSLTMWIDTWKIYKLLLNLIFNNIRHMQRGDCLHVTLSRQGGGGVVTLWDTSKNLPVDTVKQFGQNSIGTDSGITISSELAKLHGGALMFTSPKGKGTIVAVKLPIRNPVTEQYTNVVDHAEADSVMSLILTELSDVLDDRAFSSVYQD